MMYSVRCPCGMLYDVPQDQIGKPIVCRCRRWVKTTDAQPAQSKTDLPARSIEIELADAIRFRLLPTEDDCLKCNMPTDAVAYTVATCEQEHGEGLSDVFMVLFRLLFGLTFRFLTFFFSTREEEIDRGKNLHFRLPLRLCKTCQRSTWRSQVRSLALKVQPYQRLIEKYPKTSFSRIYRET